MRRHLSAKIDGVPRIDLAISRHYIPYEDTARYAGVRTFTNAVRDVLKVSKNEMQTRIESHKESGKRLSKGASLGSAASSKVRSSFGNS